MLSLTRSAADREGYIQFSTWGGVSVLSIQTESFCNDASVLQVERCQKNRQRYPDTGVFSYLTLSYSIVEVMRVDAAARDSPEEWRTELGGPFRDWKFSCTASIALKFCLGGY